MIQLREGFAATALLMAFSAPVFAQAPQVRPTVIGMIAQQSDPWRFCGQETTGVTG